MPSLREQVPEARAKLIVPPMLAKKLAGEFGERLAADVVREHIVESARALAGDSVEIGLHIRAKARQTRRHGGILVRPIGNLVSYLRLESEQLSRHKGKGDVDAARKLIASLRRVLSHAHSMFNGQHHPDILAIVYQRSTWSRFLRLPIAVMIFEVKTNNAEESWLQQLAISAAKHPSISYQAIRFHFEFDIPAEVEISTWPPFELLKAERRPRKQRASYPRVEL